MLEPSILYCKCVKVMDNSLCDLCVLLWFYFNHIGT